VLDVPVAQVGLQGSGIMTLVGQREATGVNVPKVSDEQMACAEAVKKDYQTTKAQLKRIPVILKHSLRERNSWRIRLGLVVG
jgi:hypothetical protein